MFHDTKELNLINVKHDLVDRGRRWVVVDGSPWALPSPPFPTFDFECVAMTFHSLPA